VLLSLARPLAWASDRAELDPPQKNRKIKIKKDRKK
jgi:hypothetical protein